MKSVESKNWECFSVFFRADRLKPEISKLLQILSYYMKSACRWTCVEVLILLSFSLYAENNLLKNGNFEEELSAWTVKAEKGTGTREDIDVKTNEEKQKHAQVRGKTDTVRPWMEQTDIPVKAGERYTFSLRYKSDYGKNGYINIRFLFFDAHQNALSKPFFNQIKNLSLNWEIFSSDFLVPEKAEYMTLSILLPKGSGVMRLGNLSLKKKALKEKGVLDADNIKSFSDPYLISSLLSSEKPICCEEKIFMFKYEAKNKDLPLNDITDEEREKGYLVFRRAEPRETYPDSIPTREEITEKIRGFATPGEYEPLYFSIHTLREQKEIKISLDDDLINEKGERIKKNNIDIRRVTSHIQRGGRRDSSLEYTFKPELLEKIIPLDLPENFTQSFWLTIKVPENAAPGNYKLKAVISLHSSPSTEVSLELRVLPFQLKKPDVNWSVYNNFLSTMSDDELKMAFTDLMEHGINSLYIDAFYYYGASPKNIISLEIKKGELVKFDSLKIRRFQKIRKEIGMKGPLIIHWQSRIENELGKALGLSVENGKFDALSFDKDVMGNETLKKCFKEAVVACDKLVKETGKDEGYNEWLYAIVDEPHNKGAGSPKEKRAMWESELVRSTGVKTYMTTAYPFSLEIAPYSNVQCFGAESFVSSKEINVARSTECERFGITPWWYGSGCYSGQDGGLMPNRYLSGFLFYKSGAKGQVSWIYHYQWGKDSYNDLDGRNADWAIVYYSKDGQEIIPTLQWEGIREGIDDYKYIYTLSSLIRGAMQSEGKSKEKAIEIEKKLDQLLNSLPWMAGGRGDIVVSNDTIAKYRWLIAGWIIELQKLTKER